MSYSTTQLAEIAGVTLKAIRFWEANDLFGIVARDGRGDRRFSEEQRDFSRIIQSASMAGMSVKEIAELRRTWQSPLTREQFRVKLVEARDFLTTVETEVYRTEFDL